MRRLGPIAALAMAAAFVIPIFSHVSAEQTCADGTETITSPITVTTDRTFTCGTTVIKGSVTVEDGGALNLGSTRLVIDSEASSAMVLRVKSGGSLAAEPGARVAGESGSAPRLEILLETGSEADMVGVRFSHLETLRVLTSDAEISNIIIEDVPLEAVQVLDASPTLRGLHIVGGSIGVRVDGSTSAPILEDVRVEAASLAALQVGPGARVEASRSLFDGLQMGAVLRGDAVLVQNQGSFGSSPVQVEFVPVGQASPQIELEDGRFDLDAFRYRGPDVTVVVRSQLRTVVLEDPQNPGVDVAGVDVKVRRQAGPVEHELVTDAFGRTTPMVVPWARYESGTLVEDTSDWEITAAQGSSVSARSFSLNDDLTDATAMPAPSFRFYDADGSGTFGQPDALFLAATSSAGAVRYGDVNLDGAPSRVLSGESLLLPLEPLDPTYPMLCQHARGEAGAHDDAFYFVLAGSTVSTIPVGAVRLVPPVGHASGSRVEAGHDDAAASAAASCLAPAHGDAEAAAGTYRIHQVDVGPNAGVVDADDPVLIDTGPAANIFEAVQGTRSGPSTGDIRVVAVEGFLPGTMVAPGDPEAGWPAFDRRIPIILPLDEDVAPPTWTEQGASLADAGGGFSADGRVRLIWNAATDGPNERHAVDHYRVLHDGGTVTRTLTTDFTELVLMDLPSGVHAFRVAPVDLAGLEGTYSDIHQVTVDRTRPEIQFSTTGPAGPVPNHFNGPFAINITAAEPENIDTLRYRIGDTGDFLDYVQNITIDADGVYNVTARATNPAGGMTETARRFVLDRQTPQLAAQLTPAAPDGASGWYKTAPRLTAAAQDRGPAGLQVVRYQYEGDANWTNVTGSAVLDKAGDGIVFIQALDRAGNNATTSRRVAVDATPPEVAVDVEAEAGEAGWYVGDARLRVNASDDTSGVAGTEYRLASGLWTDILGGLDLTHSGSHRVGVRAVDVAGNPSDERTTTINLDKDPPVAPTVRWIHLSDGHLRGDWAGGAPLDLVSGLAEVRVELGDTQGKLRQSYIITPDEAGIVVGPLPNGNHTIRIVVSDLAGNAAHTPQVPVSIRDSPASSLSADIQKARGLHQFTYVPPAGFSPAEVRLLIDGQLVAASLEPPYEFVVDTTQYTDGLHEVRFVAKSQSGEQIDELFSIEIRNAYVSILSDHWLPVAATTSMAALSLIGALAVGVGWRRWIP